MFAAAIKWSFQSGCTRITGGDVSKVQFQTEDRNFAEVIGDFVKGLVTGTTNANDVFNEKNKKKIYTQNDGDNHITNLGSYCTINSGVGNDLVFNHEGTQSNYVDAGNADDTVVAYGKNNTIIGELGNDEIVIYSDGKIPAGGNFLDGGAGADSLNSGNGNDTLSGNAGDDILIGGKNDDSLNGGKGNDLIYGGAGNDILKGGDDNDTLSGGKDSDKIYGDADNDSLSGDDGKDTLRGGNGKAGGSFSDATFSGDELTLAISGGGTVILDGVHTGDKININSKTYTVKGKTLK